MNKKGYFFMMDLIFSVILLVVGFMLISSFDRAETKELYNKHLSRELLSLLGNTKLSDICTSDAFGVWTCNAPYNQISPNFIRGKNQNMLEIMGELYVRNLELDPVTTKRSRELAGEVAKAVIFGNGLFDPNIYGVAVVIRKASGDQFVVYTYDSTNPSSTNQKDLTITYDSDSFYKTIVRKDKVKVFIPASKIVLGYYEDSATGQIRMWGPYTIEVWSWEVWHE